jgi:hypothetical protein
MGERGGATAHPPWEPKWLVVWEQSFLECQHIVDPSKPAKHLTQSMNQSCTWLGISARRLS